MLPFSPPDIGQEEIDEVVDSLRSGWITTGPKIARFEQALGGYLGCENVIALNSATAGLFLCLKVLGIGPGDEVITTPYTFAATVNVILHAGAVPVLADVCRDDFNIDPAQIERAVTPKTRAVIPVHFAGRSCDMDAIGAIAKRHDLAVIEDAAHAIGAEYQGQKIGSISRFTVFSFHAVKNVTTGEGGAITTNDSGMADRLRTMALHGMNKDAWKRFAPGGKWQYDIVTPGYKYNMMDLQAALGIHQLRKLDGNLIKRKNIVDQYRNGLSGISQIALPGDSADGRHCWHLFPLLIDFAKLKIGRDRFIELLLQENISSNVHYLPVHLFSYYQEQMGFKPGDFPVAEDLSAREITLPLYTRLTPDDVDDVIFAVRKIISNNIK
ncbi:MAG: DegT/DnrJ/EryC1/StrS family aminotransferase [Candidatus Edwardsbacteria bacterium]|nr:DegT/DnrJ/EryC1/StrS family aminotransferase [Candidatus Edwardsbacteria bacterium]MBU1576520.1 DegT/DnrJ/EryC1/StrS family aminotransferase [Candidatus Edwardsbacteria bacterium]MBU2464071.1 DegT/DnrJ/EryC1/StrS family aminotransferase [Candidatus Edwardsbacteria bacterium]MBU2593871.1 DegT/DnrJ/EryC1/StrS family aminotransferase [Candidatus Edwardsbacteria bacterium]